MSADLLQSLRGELGGLAKRLGARATAERKPPLLGLPDHDGSLSALLYGRAGQFDTLPFPNMEWWWNTVEVEVESGARYFLLTNVHSFGTLAGPPVTCGTLAVFDVRSGQRWGQCQHSWSGQRRGGQRGGRCRSRQRGGGQRGGRCRSRQRGRAGAARDRTVHE